MDGPKLRWAPEQFMHTNTPKSKDAPWLIFLYSREICHCSRRKV